MSDLVEPDELTNAVAINSASFNGARLIGPAVAGILIALVGTGWVFMINALSFAAPIAALALLRTKDVGAPPRNDDLGASPAWARLSATCARGPTW